MQNSTLPYHAKDIKQEMRPHALIMLGLGYVRDSWNRIRIFVDLFHACVDTCDMQTSIPFRLCYGCTDFPGVFVYTYPRFPRR